MPANEVTPQHPHKPFPGWVYGVLFVIFDIIVVTALEVGVSSSSTRVQLSSPTVGFGFVSKMWTDGNFVFVLNVILVALLYLMLLMLFNRFWTASIVILAVGIIVAAIEHFKVEIRYEAILPADLGFLGSNTGNMLTFIPAGAHVTILVALGAFAVARAQCGDDGDPIVGDEMVLDDRGVGSATRAFESREGYGVSRERT